MKEQFNRRSFLKCLGLSALAGLVASSPLRWIAEKFSRKSEQTITTLRGFPSDFSPGDVIQVGGTSSGNDGLYTIAGFEQSGVMVVEPVGEADARMLELMRAKAKDAEKKMGEIVSRAIYGEDEVGETYWFLQDQIEFGTKGGIDASV